MQNSSRPRHNFARSVATVVPASPEGFAGVQLREAPEMFNILLALESARGLLNVRDVATLLGKSPFSIYRMAQKQKIPSLMIGGSRLFDPSVLAMWLSKKEPALATAARRLRSA